MSIKELQYSYQEFQMQCVLQSGLLLSGMEEVWIKEITGDGETLVIPDQIVIEDYDVQGNLYCRTLPVCALLERACHGKNKLRRVELGCNIRQLGTNAFAQCKNLEAVIWNEADGVGHLALEDGVFSGCRSLRTLSVLPMQKETLARMLAEAVTHLSAQYLLEMDEIGSEDWYNIWDGCLLAYIKKPEDEGYAQSLLDDTFLTLEQYRYMSWQKKIELCIVRLLASDCLADVVKQKLEAYLCGCAKGRAAEALWCVVTELYAEDTECLSMLQHCGVICPETVDALLAFADTTAVSLRGFLLQYMQAKRQTGEDFAMFQL